MNSCEYENRQAKLLTLDGKVPGPAGNFLDIVIAFQQFLLSQNV